MVGKLIRSRRRFPLGAAIFAAGAAVWWVVGGSAEQPAVREFAVVPAMIAVALACTGGRPFRARFTNEAIEVDRPESRRIPYTDILALSVLGDASTLRARRRAPRELELDFGVGWLRIPGRLTHPIGDVAEFLLARLGFSGSRRVDMRLVKYLEEQEATFGPERVFTYFARRGGRPTYGVRPMATAIALLAGVAIWMALGRPQDGLGERAAILCPAIFAACMLGAVSFARPAGPTDKLRNASLVVGPAGLALMQGATTGVMRWEELREVRYGAARVTDRSFQLSSMRAMVLRVEGADIAVADAYDRPLSAIERVILVYWKGVVKCPTCGAELRASTGPVCAGVRAAP